MPEFAVLDEVGVAVSTDLPVAVFEATRALFWIGGAAEVAAIARDLVRALHGQVVLASESDGDAIPVDISFGVGPPVVPSAPRANPSRRLLERYLPAS